jgi:hypothetical protein
LIFKAIRFDNDVPFRLERDDGNLSLPGVFFAGHHILIGFERWARMSE